MRAAREAAGPAAKLFVDAGASDAYWPHGLKWALRTAEMLKDYDIGWFEEALKPDAIEDFCTLRRASPVPIAGGEVLTRRQSFLPWLTRGAFDIVQPDVTKVGGISEQRRIAWMAYDFGVKYIGHGWNTALGVAADLQLAAALPDVDLVEFIGGSPYVDGITEKPFALDARGLSGDSRSARPRRRARSREARPLHAGPRAALRLRSGGVSPPASRRYAVQLCTDESAFNGVLQLIQQSSVSLEDVSGWRVARGCTRLAAAGVRVARSLPAKPHAYRSPASPCGR